MKYLELSKLKGKTKSRIKERLDVFLWDTSLKNIDINDLLVSDNSIHIPGTDFSIQFKLSYICPWEEGLYVSEIKLVGSDRIDTFSLGSTIGFPLGNTLDNIIKNGRTILLASLRELKESYISRFIRRLPEKVFNFLSTKEICYRNARLLESITLDNKISIEVDKDNKAVQFMLMGGPGKCYNDIVKLNNFKKGLRLFIDKLENEIQ